MANQDILTILEQRIGWRHAGQRLGIEKDHEAQVFGQGINFFHIENLYGPIALGRQEDAGDALAHRRAERARREADERAAYEKAADLESERPLPDLDATDAEMTREEQEGQQQQEAQYQICTQGRPQGSTTGRTS